MWNPADNSEIFYLSGEGSYFGHVLMSARMALDTLKVLAKGPVAIGPITDVAGYSFDYDPKSDRFLVIQSREDTMPKTEVRLILNSWK